MQEDYSFDGLLALFPIIADKGWDFNKALLRDKDGRCPICSFAYEVSDGEINLVEAAWRAYGSLLDVVFLPTDVQEVMCQIMRAADSPTSLRRGALVRALGGK